MKLFRNYFKKPVAVKPIQSAATEEQTGNVAELDLGVIQEIKLSQELSEVKRSGTRGEIQYRLAWVRTKAKQNELVTREADRTWKITEKGQALLNVR